MFDTVKKLLVEEMQIDEKLITPEAELVKDLGINSLELADLILVCEENFGIEINDDNIRKFITVGDIVNYLNENVKNN